MFIMKEFEKNSIIIFFFTITVNIINYLFQIIMGRMLDVSQFGLINTLFSFYALLTMPSLAIIMIVSKYVTEYNTLNKNVNALLNKIIIYVLLFALSYTIICISLSRLFSLFLNINNVWFVNIIILITGLSFILPVINGGLQGTKLFIALGIVNLIFWLTRLFGSIIFVIIGLGINGVLISLLLGNIIAIIVGFIFLKYKIELVRENIIYDINIIKFIWITFLMNIGINILTNIDVILIKHYFSEEETGIYSVSSLLGKIIFFISSSIVLVMFPYATEAAVKKINTNRILLKTVLYGGSLTILCGVILNIFSKYIIRIFFGIKYIESAVFILPISVWTISVSFIIILSNYVIAINKAKLLSYTLIIGCIISFIFIYFIHDTILNIIYIFASITFIVLIINSISIIINIINKEVLYEYRK